MSALRNLIDETPDLVTRLRTAIYHSTPNRPDPEDTAEDEIKHVIAYGPRDPCNVDYIDQADAEAAVLIRWAEELSGDAVQGNVWRIDGFARGLLYDDMRPVYDARRIMHTHLDTGLVEVSDMEHEFRQVRARTAVVVADWLLVVVPASDVGQIVLHLG